MKHAANHRSVTSVWLAGIPLFVALGIAPQFTRGQETQKPKSQTLASQTKTQAKQQTFSSPEEAAEALYECARKHDVNEMVVILGPGSKDLVMWTDDPSMREADTDVFAQKYAQMHRLVREPDDETTLYVGAENWPLPIPLVEKNGVWYFDTALGRQEILYRRIGENELETVDTLHDLVDAQNEYYSESGATGGPEEYAQRLNSDSGQRNGLYRSASQGSQDSMIGSHMAQASFDQSDHKPLNGYYFRVLTQQGAAAPGGAHSYIENGKMTGGFAFVAFPAEYRSSGVCTFIVSQAGAVYEKDLGPMTAQIAKAMKSYNPDSTWSRVH